MSTKTKIESNHMFTVYFGENKNVSVSMTEAKNATEAIEKAKKHFHTSLECTAVESSVIHSGTIGIECDAGGLSEDAVFEIVVRGTDAEKVEKLKNAIAIAIGGMAVEFHGLSNGESDGRSLQKAFAENGMSVVCL